MSMAPRTLALLLCLAVPALAAEEQSVKLDAAAQARGAIVTASPQPVRQALPVRGWAVVLDVAPLADLAARQAEATARAEAATARRDAARHALDRARRLLSDQQNVSAAEVESAEATLRADEAEAQAAAAAERAAAEAARLAWGRPVADAMAADSETFRHLVDGRARLVQVTLPVGAVPETVTVDAGAGGGRLPLRYLSPAVRADQQIGGVGGLYLADANDRLLPGAYLPAYGVSAQTEAGVLVPESAVVRWQGADWVYLRIADGRFARRRIDTGRPSADGAAYFVTGLPAGATLVVAGTQLLLSEEFKALSQAGDTD